MGMLYIDVVMDDGKEGEKGEMELRLRQKRELFLSWRFWRDRRLGLCASVDYLLRYLSELRYMYLLL